MPSPTPVPFPSTVLLRCSRKDVRDLHPCTDQPMAAMTETSESDRSELSCLRDAYAVSDDPARILQAANPQPVPESRWLNEQHFVVGMNAQLSLSN